MSLRARLRVQGASRVLGLLCRVLSGPRATVRRVEKWLQERTILRPGTRVRINGKCCRDVMRHQGKVATILDDDHTWDDPDYHVHVDGLRYGKGNAYHYVCERGFDVVEYR